MPSCPICRRPVTWEGNPDRPFCSERCRLIDLGRWVDGRYAIPGPPVDPLSMEERVEGEEGREGRGGEGR